MRGEVDAEMETKFREWDATHARETLSEIRGLLNRRKYISNLIEKSSV